MIQAVPVTYQCIRFRSTLEADWAATLNAVRIVWQYEPEAVQLPSGQLYRPDFYLPEITTWLEVKGPHDERLEKTEELAMATLCPPDCHAECTDDDHLGPLCPCNCERPRRIHGGQWDNPWRQVAVGRAPSSEFTLDGELRALVEPVYMANGLIAIKCTRCYRAQWATTVTRIEEAPYATTHVNHHCRHCQLSSVKRSIREDPPYPNRTIPFFRAPRNGAR